MQSAPVDRPVAHGVYSEVSTSILGYAMHVLTTLVPRLGLPCEMANVTLSKSLVESSLALVRCSRRSSNNTGPDRLLVFFCSLDVSAVSFPNVQLMQAYTSG